MNRHLVQLYQDPACLADAVAEYVRDGLARGEGVVVIARPEIRAPFQEDPVVLLDAEETLWRIMAQGMPSWTRFRDAIGGSITDLRRRYPAVRAFGDMVDVLWQRGDRAAAIRLEEYWNELGRVHAFSLFCAYRLDPLDPNESICSVHTHLLPPRERADFDEEVKAASRKVLDEPLAGILLGLAAARRANTEMSAGQATLFWLKQNMPRAAERVLRELRASAP